LGPANAGWRCDDGGDRGIANMATKALQVKPAWISGREIRSLYAERPG